MKNMEQDQPRSAAEKISLGVALCILLLMIGAIVFSWVSSEGSEAHFSITRQQVRAEGDQFYLPLVVINEGDETASQILIEGTLTVDGKEESADTTVDFIPGHAEAEVVLIFSADPRDAEVRVASYQDP